MSVEVTQTLDESTVKTLQDLIRINLDSEQGFLEAAKEIDDAVLTTLFNELAKERAENATALQEYVMWNGETPVEEGSYAAAFHRVWIDLRAKLNSGDAHVILVEAERGEDQIKRAYEQALQDLSGSGMIDVLARQYASVKIGHDRVRDLRDSRAG